MKLNNQIRHYCYSLLVLIPLISQADIEVNVTATMVDPICDLRSQDNSSPLKINFGVLKTEALNTVDATQDFSLYISGCNFNRTLAISLNPKGTNSLPYEGKNILATSIDGLGIEFAETTGDSNSVLEIGKTQQIYPARVEDTKYRIDLQAKLVSAVPLEKLEVGKLTSAVTFSVTYY